MARLFRNVRVTKAVLVEGDPLDPSKEDWIYLRGNVLPGAKPGDAIVWDFRAVGGSAVAGTFTRGEIEAEQRGTS